MIEIHQAICGDDNGSFSLLKSSYTNPTIPIRFASSTDLIDRPPNGELEEPVIRGFWKGNHFILIKTFPDTSKGMRVGRVFSHALIIEENDFLFIQDITSLFKYFLESIDKSLELKPIHFKNSHRYDETLKEDKRLSYAINSLIKHHENYNTIVWIGNDNYQNWISRVWPAIPKDIKRNIKIGVAFDPQKVDKDLLNLIYVPDAIKPNWINTNFKIVDYNNSGNLKTQTAYYLAGHMDKSKELSLLLSDFSIVPKDIDDISQFEKMIPAYNEIDTVASLKKLIIFADLVSKYTTNTQSSLPSRQRLFDAILGKINEATILEINMLTSPNWSGFKDAEKKISESLDSWLKKNVYAEANSKIIPSLINKAFSDTENTWWSNPIKKYVSIGFKQWKKTHAKLFWNWIIAEPALIEKLKSILPISAENDIISDIPKLKKEVEEKVLRFASDNSWIFLHGTLVVKNHSTKDALRKQLSIDTDPNEFGALRIISEKTPSEKFLISSLNFEDDRLYVLSGEVCGKNTKLLSKNIVLDNSRWHKLWLEFINQGNDVWAGFSSPTKTLHKILDNIIHGSTFDDNLLQKISTSSTNDLIDYPRRNEAWSILTGQTKINFLSKTAQSSLISITKNTLSVEELETPLREEIQKYETINGLIKSSSVEITSKIELLKVFPNIDKKHAIYLIDKKRFSSSEAIVLGETIKINQWKSVASHVSSIVLLRPDLKLVIQQCAELLNAIQRLGLSLSGLLNQSISHDEWWEIFTNRAIKLYPKGADQNGIWSNAGGHDSDLPLKMPGKEIWNHAVKIIRNGGDPKVFLLMDKMLEEFPHDEILKKLRKTI